jgi:adenylate cyclase
MTWRGAWIGIICALLCWALNGAAWIRGLENWLSDGNFAFRGRRPSTANVVIVEMDEASLQELAKPLMFLSPELAKVVTYLHDQGAAAIGVDITVSASDATMPYLLPNGPGAADTMGQAVGRAGNVVLPEWLGVEPAQFPLYEWMVPSSRPWADLGFVDLKPDADLCLRRQELRIEDDSGSIQPNMALALLIKAWGLSQEWLAAEKLELDDQPVPLDSDGCLRINYVGPAGSIRNVSFRKVLAAATRTPHAPRDAKSPIPHGEREEYKDAIVLIGMSAATFQDNYVTPYTYPSIFQAFASSNSESPFAKMPGVEVSANVAATLLDRAFITTPWFLATPLMLIVVGGLMGSVLGRCSLELGALLAVVHHMAWRAFSAGAFCLAGWRVEMASMLLLGVVLYGAIFAMRWRWIRRMMGMVKSEAVARALENSGTKLDLRGQQREISVLFCDIRNFTTFSERHSPHEVVRLLNTFFATVVPAIEAEQGTVNQYIGDAVMVIFGAPQTQPDHALRAVRAAVEMVRRVHQLSDRWKELGAERFRIGIGVHTGNAVVGTVGSPRRLDYTAIGDTVNTASRIESANKELQSEILISQSTFAALPDEEKRRIAAMGEPKPLTVKGRQETLEVYLIH